MSQSDPLQEDIYGMSRGSVLYIDDIVIQNVYVITMSDADDAIILKF